MAGHGHVTPNPDGSKARCGGPRICNQCALEAAAQRETPKQQDEMGAVLEVALSAAMNAYGTANKTPAYHSYVSRLQEVIHELIDMKQMA